jgi:hypothetical protein
MYQREVFCFGGSKGKVPCLLREGEPVDYGLKSIIERYRVTYIKKNKKERT